MALRLSRILVPVDGTSASAPAIDFALRVARDYGAHLIFVNVVDHGAAVAECSTAYGVNPGPLIEELDEQSGVLLKSIERRCADANVPATTARLDGPPVRAIIDAAESRSADAIVIGTHGNRGLRRFALGSTAEEVLRLAGVPTFVVHATEGTSAGATPDAPAFGKILVAVDDSAPSDAAVAFALDLAERSGGEVAFIHIVCARETLESAAEYGYDPTAITRELHEAAMVMVDHAKELAAERGVPCVAVVMEGEPVDGLLKATETQHADLLVMGTHGRRGLRRLFLGSVAEQTIRESIVPVAAIRQYQPSARTPSSLQRAPG